jgi:hypothetical protein
MAVNWKKVGVGLLKLASSKAICTMISFIMAAFTGNIPLLLGASFASYILSILGNTAATYWYLDKDWQKLELLKKYEKYVQVIDRIQTKLELGQHTTEGQERNNNTQAVPSVRKLRAEIETPKGNNKDILNHQHSNTKVFIISILRKGPVTALGIIAVMMASHIWGLQLINSLALPLLCVLIGFGYAIYDTYKTNYKNASDLSRLCMTYKTHSSQSAQPESKCPEKTNLAQKNNGSELTSEIDSINIDQIYLTVQKLRVYKRSLEIYLGYQEQNTNGGFDKEARKAFEDYKKLLGDDSQHNNNYDLQTIITQQLNYVAKKYSERADKLSKEDGLGNVLLQSVYDTVGFETKIKHKPGQPVNVNSIKGLLAFQGDIAIAIATN